MQLRFLHRSVLLSPSYTSALSTRAFSRVSRLLEAKATTPASRPSPRRAGNSTQLPVLPLVAIFCLGSGSFYFLTKSREGVTHQTYTAGEKAPGQKDQWPGRRRDTEQ